ncbi:MAG: 16S rRNA (cytidine(1402)-2'-O)-methyltransferase [Pseudomonadota bacterium]
MIEPGLHFVATPIGTADDITLRALKVLREADVIAAEDTRRTRHLMDIHGVPLGARRLVAYHDHNGARIRPRLLAELAEGRSLAYASDAGTPLVADPGLKLAQAAIEAGLPVISVPGPSAVMAALTVAGLPTDQFYFAGFLPPKATARRVQLDMLAQLPATQVLFEAPSRIVGLLSDAVQSHGAPRPAALCRELTKKFEEIQRHPLGTLAAQVSAPPKGELVLVIGGAKAQAWTEADIDTALTIALRDGSVKDAVNLVCETIGAPKKVVYQRALALKQD